MGGQTIAEAQERISYPEYLSWLAYRKKRGSLHIGMRIEHAAALIVTQQANMNRKQGVAAFKTNDFMPHADQPEVTMEKAKEVWG
ncbi:MAG: phage tail assembly protein T [Halomonas sp.]|uniref:phage tail assembly protein T n=1 Tax=Halomonas sp. TaxID=1486246 RepID=UPI003F945078